MNSNYKKQYVQGGVISTDNANGYFRYKHVTFSKVYASTPTVVATVINYACTATDASLVTLVQNASKTGVDIYVGKPDGGLDTIGYKVSWIAIGTIS